MTVVVAGVCRVAGDVLGSVPTADLVNVTDCWKLCPSDILCGLDKSLYSLLVLLCAIGKPGFDTVCDDTLHSAPVEVNQ